MALVTRVRLSVSFRHRAIFFSIVALSALSNVLPRYTAAAVVSNIVIGTDCSKKKNCKRRRAKTIPRFIFLLTYQRVIYTIGAIYALVTFETKKKGGGRKKRIERTDVWKSDGAMPENISLVPHLRQSMRGIARFCFNVRSRCAVAFAILHDVERAKEHEFSTEYTDEFAGAIEESRCTRNAELREREKHEWHEF